MTANATFSVFHHGANLACKVDGPPDAPWVMLSHGLATDMHLWDELTASLRTNFRVLRHDARGHGKSTATPGDYSSELLAADAIAILDHLEVATVHIVGLSMGGMVGIQMALDHPQRIASAVVANARGIPSPEYLKSWSERKKQVLANGIESLVEPTVLRWLTAGFHQRDPIMVERMRVGIRNTSREGYCGCAAALQEMEFGTRLKCVRVPMLFISGSEDRGVPPEVVREMHERTPGSMYAEIANAAHLTNLEWPDEFARVVRGFITQHA